MWCSVCSQEILIIVQVLWQNGGQVILSRMSHDFKGVSMICMQSPSSITNLKLHTVRKNVIIRDTPVMTEQFISDLSHR